MKSVTNRRWVLYFILRHRSFSSIARFLVAPLSRFSLFISSWFISFGSYFHFQRAALVAEAEKEEENEEGEREA